MTRCLSSLLPLCARARARLNARCVCVYLCYVQHTRRMCAYAKPFVCTANGHGPTQHTYAYHRPSACDELGRWLLACVSRWHSIRGRRHEKLCILLCYTCSSGHRVGENKNCMRIVIALARSKIESTVISHSAVANARRPSLPVNENPIKYSARWKPIRCCGTDVCATHKVACAHAGVLGVGGAARPLKC